MSTGGCSPLHMQMRAPLRLGFLVFSLAFKMMPLPVIQYFFRRLSFSEESSEYVESVLSELDRKRFSRIYGGLRKEVLPGIDEHISQQVLIPVGRPIDQVERSGRPRVSPPAEA